MLRAKSNIRTEKDAEILLFRLIYTVLAAQLILVAIYRYNLSSAYHSVDSTSLIVTSDAQIYNARSE